LLYGNIGSGNRLDFTCIGPAVNPAARLEKLAGRLDRTVLASQDFASRCDDSFEPLGCFAVAGFAEGIRNERTDRRESPKRRGRSFGWTWISSNSTTPATSSSTRRTATKRRLANSAAARARIGEPLRFAYGSAPIEALDVCQPRENKTGAGDASAPVAVFVLGGAWRTGDASEFTFLAEPFVRAAPISRCFGGDRERLYLISHSSGSHLAGLRRDTRLGERGITPRHS